MRREGSWETIMDELLKLLQKNARETPAHLATLLNRSEADVREQMAGYEKSGVIRGSSTLRKRRT